MAETTASFTTKVRSGRNTYYIDVKESKKGTNYLSITENQYDGTENRKTTIRVFGDAIEKFREAINEAANSIAGG